MANQVDEFLGIFYDDETSNKKLSQVKIQIENEEDDDDDYFGFLQSQLNSQQQSPPTQNLEKLINETTDIVNNFGILDKGLQQDAIKKIRQIKKKVTSIIEIFFDGLNQTINRIFNNQDIQERKQEAIKDIMKFKQEMMRNNVNLDGSSLETIKKKFAEMKTPQKIIVNMNTEIFYQIKTKLEKLVSIQFFVLSSEPFNYLPVQILNLKKTQKAQIKLVQSKSKIKQHEFLYFFNGKGLSSYNVNMNTLTHKDHDIKFNFGNILCNEKKVYLLALFNFNSPTSHCLQLDSSTNTLTPLPSFPINVYKGQCVIQDQVLYYWGGLVQIENNEIYTKKGYRLNLSNANQFSWEQVDPMKRCRVVGSACTLNEKIYIFGGMETQFIKNSCIEIFQDGLFIDYLELNNHQCYIPALNGFALSIGQNEILLFGGRSCQHDEDSPKTQLIRLDYKCVIQGSQSTNIENQFRQSQPVIFNQKIHLVQNLKSKKDWILENRWKLVELSYEQYITKDII